MASPTCAQDGVQHNFLQWVPYFLSSNYETNLQHDCCLLGVDLSTSCVVNFFSNNTVNSFGNITRGHFEANPDIAGYGVWISLASALFVNIVAILFVVREWSYRLRGKKSKILPTTNKSNSKGHPSSMTQKGKNTAKGVYSWLKSWMKELFRVTIDAQLVLAFSYALNFGLESKCTLSAYHYNFAVDTLILSLSCVTLSVYVLDDFWRSKWIGCLRTAASIIIYTFLCRYLYYQMERNTSPELMFTPTPGRSDSSLLLPMACFLDPDLDPFISLAPEQRDAIGGPGPKVTPAFVFCYMLAVGYVGAHLEKFLTRNRPNYHQNVFLTTAFVVLCSIPCFLSYAHLTILRDWVDMSGWMEVANGGGSPEKEIRSIGQIMPLATIFWILAISFDTGKLARRGVANQQAHR
ncbi:Mannosyl-oligosaccharide alpha-1,2-mannosidase 1B [Podospora bellae-mahoneyi]|uniref:Mannosyl-oligosaccharide alpha-1,2-mannosidase 1B n=1 Tax=Podospora bellae-mahoneyi TaxID=2093777 RepID=A0ABR0F5T4_9PEZI|nr:Mannosyl-oligosaccharide alpha-1,2-mannosidase 1B [Podospora bellae-mahoneyi]